MSGDNTIENRVYIPKGCSMGTNPPNVKSGTPADTKISDKLKGSGVEASYDETTDDFAAAQEKFNETKYKYTKNQYAEKLTNFLKDKGMENVDDEVSSLRDEIENLKNLRKSKNKDEKISHREFDDKMYRLEAQLRHKLNPDKSEEDIYKYLKSPMSFWAPQDEIGRFFSKV